MIEIESLYFKYYRRNILNGISHTFKSGSFTAIMGHNGCGKTTLLKNIAGMLHPYSGNIKINGKSIKDFTLIELAKIVGYVPQKTLNVPSMTVIESVLCGRLPYIKWSETGVDKHICHSIISELGLSHIKNKNINEISGGEIQKTLIAQALAKEPEILLLDEPLNNLDLRNQLEIMKIIAKKTTEKKLTTIAVIHDLNSALKFCDEIILIKNFEIVFSGPPEKLSPETVKDVFCVECELLKNENRIFAIY